MSNEIITLGVDLGRAGKTAFCVLTGNEQFTIHCPHLSALSSVSSPQVEESLMTMYGRFTPDVIVLENNGPGGIFVDYLLHHHQELLSRIISIDTSLPPLELELWNDLKLSAKELLNVRAEMYWLTRLLFKERRITLSEEDEELFAQLSTIAWDWDTTRNDKIYIISKRKLNLRTMSELGGELFSKSPDKADSLALAALGYAIVVQEFLTKTSEEQEEEFTQPLEGYEGFFDIGRAGIDA